MYYPVYALYRYYPDTFWIRTALTLFLLFSGIFLISQLFKKKGLSRRGRNTAILWWVYTMFLLYITVLGRYCFEDFRSRLDLFISYRQAFIAGNGSELRALILNILIFVPFGLITAELIKKRFPAWAALIPGFILTLVIELLQLVTRTGTFEIDDLINNTLGTALGILLWYGLRALYRKLKKNKELSN